MINLSAKGNVMKNKNLINNPRFWMCVVVAGGVMMSTSIATFGIGNNLLYKKKQKENPDKVFENAMSALDTAGTIALCQIALSVPFIFGGLAMWRKKEKQHE